MKKILIATLLATALCSAQQVCTAGTCTPVKKGPNVPLVAVSLTGALLFGTWLISVPWRSHDAGTTSATSAAPNPDELLRGYAELHQLEVVSKDVICPVGTNEKAKLQIARRELQSCAAGELRVIRLAIVNGEVTLSPVAAQ